MNTRMPQSAPRPLVVGLNGRFSGTAKPTGTQVTSFHLFDAIIRGERDFSVTIFADESFPGIAAWRQVPRTHFVDVPFSRWRRSVAQMWEQIVLPVRAAKAGCTVLHHPMTTCPRWRNGIRQVVTVHDLTFLHHPEWVSRAFRCWLAAVAVPAIKHADHVATISDYVLKDVRRTLGIDPAKSSRIYNGLTPLPVGQASPARDGKTRVILGVNLWQPHKNLHRLIGAFSRLRGEMPALELHLAGRPQANYRTQPDLAALLERPGVRVLGYLSEQDLGSAYASADAVCYPSLEEGFGLPVLEAMAAGAPVITSDASCLPEIAGGAAVLVDPLSEEAIAAGIRRVLEEGPAERTDRIARGRRVAAGFSWNESARQYAAIYRSLAG
jgi:glycosyltransferase involved in cell wall biosynthesis